jgi:hypothetical protein
VMYSRLGRPDLTTAVGSNQPGTPIAVLLGPRAVRDLGLETLESAPLPRPERVGRDRMPSLVWTLGQRGNGPRTGPTPGPGAGPRSRRGHDGWQQLHDLVSYLKPERIAALISPNTAADNRKSGRS